MTDEARKRLRTCYSAQPEVKEAVVHLRDFILQLKGTYCNPAGRPAQCKEVIEVEENCPIGVLSLVRLKDLVLTVWVDICSYTFDYLQSTDTGYGPMYPPRWKRVSKPHISVLISRKVGSKAQELTDLEVAKRCFSTSYSKVILWVDDICNTGKPLRKAIKAIEKELKAQEE